MPPKNKNQETPPLTNGESDISPDLQPASDLPDISHGANELSEQAKLIAQQNINLVFDHITKERDPKLHRLTLDELAATLGSDKKAIVEAIPHVMPEMRRKYVLQTSHVKALGPKFDRETALALNEHAFAHTRPLEEVAETEGADIEKLVQLADEFDMRPIIAKKTGIKHHVNNKRSYYNPDQVFQLLAEYDSQNPVPEAYIPLSQMRKLGEIATMSLAEIERLALEEGLEHTRSFNPETGHREGFYSPQSLGRLVKIMHNLKSDNKDN